jgi:hypothetical protein
MASEFEKHIGMDPEKIEQSEGFSLITRTKDQIGETPKQRATWCA